LDAPSFSLVFSFCARRRCRPRVNSYNGPELEPASPHTSKIEAGSGKKVNDDDDDAAGASVNYAMMVRPDTYSKDIAEEALTRKIPAEFASGCGCHKVQPSEAILSLLTEERDRCGLDLLSPARFVA